jgi:hypothetical protein
MTINAVPDFRFSIVPHGRFQLLSQAGRSSRGVYRQTDAQENWKLALATSGFRLTDEKICFLIFKQAASVGKGSER